MRLMYLTPLICTVAFVACSSNDESTPGDVTTLELRATEDGSFRYCDAKGDCTSLPNPAGCAKLTVTVENATGKTCQVCTTSDGTVGPENCETPAVACDVVTIPDPDCVVCAYVNGTVIFSSCQPSDPICYTTNGDGSVSSSGSAGAGTPADGGALAAAPPTDAEGRVIDPAIGCTICVDTAGRRVSQDCPPICTGVMCPAITCAPGYAYVTAPGECCGHCEPVPDCERIACTMMIPECPDGQVLVKDPSTCCGWFCEPRECDATLACPAIAIVDCAPGYVVSYEAPYCCGACVPEGGCHSDADCAPEEYCALPMCPCLETTDGGACLRAPGCEPVCIPDGMAF